MANHDQIAEMVLGLLTPRLDAMEKTADEKYQQLLAEYTSLKAENICEDAQMEVLTNEHAAMKRRLEQLEEATRSTTLCSSIFQRNHLVRARSTV